MMTIPQAARAFSSDKKGVQLSPHRVRLLLEAGRIPGYKDEDTGCWVVTEARILPRVKEGHAP